MRFLPHTADDVRAMLAAVGVGSVDDLLAVVPAGLRDRAALDLPPGLPEADVRRRLETLAAANTARPSHVFLGAGAYPHFVPAVVDHVLQRAEFYSSYTPYQPEVSQGTLQAMFEFQTLTALLLGMEVANASMYDGASATAEAVLMSRRLAPDRSRVVLARSLHPHYRATVRTCCGDTAEIVEAPFGADGRVDAEWLRARADDRTAAIVVGYPNVFGIVEDLATVQAIARACGALFVTATQEALALGLLQPPGHHGADIAVAEGQSLGAPLSYGGPGVGLFATRTSFVRAMPGRLVGAAVDGEGRRGYVLTLATREQHIRRERATSNICTNHGLVALAVTVYLSAAGKAGLRTLAATNVARAHETAARLTAGGRWQLAFDAPFFNEFVLRGPDAAQAWEAARAQGIVAGLPLGRWYPDLADALLLCVTETHPADAIDALVAALGC